MKIGRDMNEVIDKQLTQQYFSAFQCLSDMSKQLLTLKKTNVLEPEDMKRIQIEVDDTYESIVNESKAEGDSHGELYIELFKQLRKDINELLGE